MWGIGQATGRARALAIGGASSIMPGWRRARSSAGEHRADVSGAADPIPATLATGAGRAAGIP